jgi:hypothetical protein
VKPGAGGLRADAQGKTWITYGLALVLVLDLNTGGLVDPMPAGHQVPEAEWRKAEEGESRTSEQPS